MEGLGFYAPETDEEFYEALSRPFMQGKPNDSCMNPICPNWEKKGKLVTVAIVPSEPVKGVPLFGKLDLGVHFQMCTNCYTIRASSLCK